MESQCHAGPAGAICPFSLTHKQDGTSCLTLGWEKGWLILVPKLSWEDNAYASKFSSLRVICYSA